MPGERSGYENTLALSIEQMLDSLPPRPNPLPSIQRVNEILRSNNEPSYEPRIVSIGPLHRGKPHLLPMDQEKKRCLHHLLLPSGDNNDKSLLLDTYVHKIRDLQDKARRCYSDPIPLGSDDFVQMLLLDSVFILHFLRRYLVLFPSSDESPPSIEFGDPVFEFGHVIAHVLHDLVLLENQIPFFVIQEMYSLTKARGPEKIGFLIEPLLVFPDARHSCGSVETDGADHLLAMVHRVSCHSFHERHSDNITDEAIGFDNINSATELADGGVRFKRVMICDWNNRTISSSLDIEFKGNKMYVPVLEVSDVTESWFRNVIAYEYCLPRREPKYVTDYMFFMHCLIHSPADAQLLRRRGVISNWLGGDDVVYRLVNRMGANVLTSNKFSYLEIFNEVHRHCERRRNRWLAILRRDYFNSPWKLISLVAGVVLLGVGVVQMVFAILSYYNDKNKGG